MKSSHISHFTSVFIYTDSPLSFFKLSSKQESGRTVGQPKDSKGRTSAPNLDRSTTKKNGRPTQRKWDISEIHDMLVHTNIKYQTKVVLSLSESLNSNYTLLF